MYYKDLEKILLEENPQNKIKMFETFYNNFLENNYKFEDQYTPPCLDKPSYSNFLNIVLPKDINIRKHFDTDEGKISLLHTIAHIEYSAIDLALDASLRYQNMPYEYYVDWLEVANDEIRHFKMIQSLLNELGSYYGQLSVHTNLFEAMKNTTKFINRMAVVPRYLEANGLDQNPKIINKLKSNPDKFNLKILDALQIILEEEVDHVKKGDRWFKYACSIENLDPTSTYLKIIEEFYPGSTSKHQKLNFDARKKAGFSCDELKQLANSDDCF
jgi:uncharacterized ferritin-like protein (DUF455 family)